LKPSADGSGIVLRLFESAGKTTNAKLSLPGKKFIVESVNLNEEKPETVNPKAIRFKPFEIITLKIMVN